MSVYQITFTPQEPYFFGNEKTFSFVGEQGRYGKLYYIKGEPLPMQSTVFGAVRYLLLPEKTFAGAARSAEWIGPESFRMDAEERQSFGRIKGISPIFLCREEEWFVPTPFDHNGRAASDRYTPFSDYGEVTTLEGKKLYARDYDAKQGVENSFFSLKDGHLERELFQTAVRVGINRREDRSGFFKREFQILEKGYSFSVLAELDLEGLDGKSDVVYMGQGKTPFVTGFCKVDCFDLLEKRTRDALRESRKNLPPEARPFWYCLSDAVVRLPEGETAQAALYQDVRFAVSQVRDYRAYQTRGDQIRKDGTLYRLLKAGSVFVAGSASGLTDDLRQNNAQTIGFNWVIRENEK